MQVQLKQRAPPQRNDPPQVRGHSAEQREHQHARRDCPWVDRSEDERREHRLHVHERRHGKREEASVEIVFAGRRNLASTRALWDTTRGYDSFHCPLKARCRGGLQQKLQGHGGRPPWVAEPGASARARRGRSGPKG